MSLGICYKKIAPCQSWRLLDTASKLRYFRNFWKFERRKVDKKANLHEHWNT